MMTLPLKKVQAVLLRDVSLDERWLQERIHEDTSLLGLGELEIIGREHRQPSKGRLDFLLYQAEADTFYEVEVMLGALDESHIVRTIEYWDIERQRRPKSDHRAVIVAEQITSRFFNILRLLNRSVPMIAVQLSAFKTDDNSISLLPVTVLDIVEEVDFDVSGQAEQTDRPYWERLFNHDSLAVVDKVVGAVAAIGIETRLTYNKYHIALRSSGNNFCWFHPRKSAGYCHIEFRIAPESRDATLSDMQEVGIDAYPRKTENITFSMTLKNLDQHLAKISSILKSAEEYSRG